jgi:hypothetical protein
MPTGGLTKPIHVYEGLAAYILTTKESSNLPVWLIVEKNLTSDFITKYNLWVKTNPTAVNAQGQRFKEIESNAW